MALITRSPGGSLALNHPAGTKHAPHGRHVDGRSPLSDLPLPGSHARLALKRGWLLKIALGLPLLLAVVGFGMLQVRPATFPQAPTEEVVRGSILAADGSVLADGPVESRSYPYGAVGASLLGFTGAVQPDGRFGLEGLEYTLDSRLAAGDDVTLTIDPVLQAAADRHLAEATLSSGAQSGSAVILEVGTGRILAAASYPTFDANDWRGAEREQMLNRPFQQVYEPGSVIKPLVIAGLYGGVEAELARLASNDVRGERRDVAAGDGVVHGCDRRVPDFGAGRFARLHWRPDRRFCGHRLCDRGDARL